MHVVTVSVLPVNDLQELGAPMPEISNSDLNVVDRFVKQNLLSRPGVYSSRLQVLQSLLFCYSHGYFWTEDGCIGELYPEQETAQMRYSDLDQYQEALDKQGRLIKTTAFLLEAAAIKHKRALRAVIADNIDLYASHDVIPETISIESLRKMDFKKSLVATAPFKALNPDWAEAMAQTLQLAKQTLYTFLDVGGEHFTQSKADPSLLTKYNQVRALSDKLAKARGSCCASDQASYSPLRLGMSVATSA
jgi:hypothetical protein